MMSLAVVKSQAEYKDNPIGCMKKTLLYVFALDVTRISGILIKTPSTTTTSIRSFYLIQNSLHTKSNS